MKVRLLRVPGDPPVIHLAAAPHFAACGEEFSGLTSLWEDNDSKVTCSRCIEIDSRWAWGFGNA